MSAQPLNADINVFLAVRSYRNSRRHESVEALTKRLRPLIMSVPAEEILTEVKSRDTAKSDFSVFARDGQPIVIGSKSDVAWGVAQEGLPEVDFFFQIGRDRFLKNVVAGLDRDLHQDVRDL